MRETATGIDLESLKQKVAEAEELNRAIKLGQVDAFVIGKSADESRVLLLANAYQRYRYIVDRMDQGAITVSANGSVLFANQKFADLIGGTMNGLYGARFEANFAETHRARLTRLLGSSEGGRELELDLVRSDGSTVPVHLHVATVSDGYATILITDLSQRQWTQEAEQSLDRMREAVNVIHRSRTLEADGRGAVEAVSAEIDALAGRLESLRPKARPAP